MKFFGGFLIGIILLSGNSFAYTDISEGHWAYSDLMALSERQIVSGYPDGTFQPNCEINKAEFLSLLQKSLFSTKQIIRTTGFTVSMKKREYFLQGTFTLKIHRQVRCGSPTKK